MGVLELSGGLPTSLQDSGLQWDWPNAWPPLQEMTIQALSACHLPEARDAAFQMAQSWVATNYKGYHGMHVMFEKVKLCLVNNVTRLVCYVLGCLIQSMQNKKLSTKKTKNKRTKKNNN